ncbi:hypothetical protein PRK78_002495 [Emydomyces testavorans]|uniref:HbrB n=1 Tax=Emydomyces testavorans TaxID=2070801 RepID=A0AAF0DGB5_9EURO|nr:hypothetical protein PRK78_002495 [Emydomyces testavorans]
MRSNRPGSIRRKRGEVSSDEPASPEHSRTTEPPPRPGSTGSDASDPLSVPPLNVPKRSLYNLSPQLPSPGGPRAASTGISSANNSNTSLPNFLRPSAPFMPQNEPVQRRPSPLALNDSHIHRRQHSQGFFEPSLPTASLSEHGSTIMAPMSASRIAAQTAMQHQTMSQHLRNRSSTIPPHQDPGAGTQKGPSGGAVPSQYQSAAPGGRAFAATTAANLVFPRAQSVAPTPAPAQESSSGKQKGEKSKMKSFLKPKHIGISRDKDGDRREKPSPSPNKLGPSGLSRMVNASTTSVSESVPSSNSSLYTFSNSSAATVVPPEKQATNDKEKEKEKDKDKDKEKEKHRHHFLSRPKLKLKDKDDHFHLPLSSASSNSRPLDPSAPQSLYSFTPSSPSTTSFGKSVSGLDLRHGGRALREKRKMEEKASASHDATSTDQPDFSGSLGTGVAAWSTFIGTGVPGASLQSKEAAMREALGSFGIPNMAFEDAWDFLKAKLLVLFEGEEVRIAIEDLNKLVSVHILRSFQRRVPNVLVEDLRDLLQTGFASLNHTLSSIPDENLVPHLVQVWTYTYGNIVPFIQAVFFPLDLEFKARGKIMEPHEAREFWGTLPNGGSAGDKLNVNDIILISFRDNIILNRYETLKAIFSRLSLERVNASIGVLGTSSNSGASRPGTAAALDAGSYNSQSSAGLNTAGSHSSESHLSTSRARAESNTSSNPDHPVFQSSIISKPADASHVVTETVGRILQCICVIAGVHTDDDAQRKVEDLRKAVTHNWLGRGRTGRDRRGFVGTRVRPAVPSRENSGEAAHGGPKESGEGELSPNSKDSASFGEGAGLGEKMKNLNL